MHSFPCTAQLVEEFALREPDRPALREDQHELTYGQFHEMILGCMQALHVLGVRHGDGVAVSGPGFGIQLLLLLAAEGLGAYTASFQAEVDPDGPFLFRQVQWVFSAVPQETPDGAHFQLLDARFLAQLQRQADVPLPAWSPAAAHERQRLSRTSGSTGLSKIMALNRTAQDYWVLSGHEKGTYNSATRLLVLGPLVMNAAYARASTCLRRGGMVIAPIRGKQLAEVAPTHIWGLPLQLDSMLAEVPAGYVSAQPVQVSTVGGVMSAVLRERTAQVFHGRVKNRYGSNEAGTICEELDLDGVGVLNAGVDVRVLDEEGRDLPAGQPGRIAVRTPALVDGYLERPDETAAQFRDGWFISSDVGMLVGYRRLRLLGRSDDLVNLGGLKVPASLLEADLRGLPAVAEVVALAVQMKADAVSLGVAVVLAEGATREQASQQVVAALRLAPGMAARLLFVPELPRMPNGKLDRMALVRAFQAAP